METANCYIVPNAGAYTFPATHRGNETTPSIAKESVSSVEVLWESFGTSEEINAGDLISKVSYKDGCVNFTATDKKGNALIAVKDANGAIIWSWHIWLTDAPQDQVYKDGVTMMDRNLGATAAGQDDGAAVYGLFYQWGRKDPFLGAPSYNSASRAVSTKDDWTTVVSDATIGTIDWAVANPTTFIHKAANSENDDWYYLEGSTMETNRWKAEKTIYDPSPAGYRVPDGGYNGVWYGLTATKDGNSGYVLQTNGGDTAWYAVGGIVRSASSYTIAWNYGGMSYFWSCTNTGSHVYALRANPSWGIFRSSSSDITEAAYGCNIRCQKM